MKLLNLKTYKNTFILKDPVRVSWCWYWSFQPCCVVYLCGRGNSRTENHLDFIFLRGEGIWANIRISKIKKMSYKEEGQKRDQDLKFLCLRWLIAPPYLLYLNISHGCSFILVPVEGECSHDLLAQLPLLPSPHSLAVKIEVGVVLLLFHLPTGVDEAGAAEAHGQLLLPIIVLQGNGHDDSRHEQD